ncbi:MAG: chitobiase/beta-hexosaminidase C-terminal domain-containing protein [Spirochaetales bacterium]|nr:chitobiase/beta-hexosaminidase C-terminal domain-containing protein [Spirochaetales bacterium]
MRKNMAPLVLGVAIFISIITGCGNNSFLTPETASLYISINEPTTAMSRTAIPTIDMEIASYDISGTHSTAPSFGPENTTLQSHNKEGLAPGEWTILVSGKNSAGDIIGEGSNTITLISGSDAAVSITVSPLQEKGSFQLNFNWDSGISITPVLNVEFGQSGGSLELLTMSYTATTAEYSSTTDYPEGITPGYYTLVAEVLDGSIMRKSFVETVRIVSNQTTTVEYTVNEEDMVEDSTGLVLYSLAEGEYGVAQTVSLSTITDGASIHYTINGSTPTKTTGLLYSSPVTVNTTQTLRAVSFKDGYAVSPITEAIYTITGTIPVPLVSMDEGLYFDESPLEFTVSTGGCTIIYTTDGSIPIPGASGTDIIYTAPLTLSNETTYNFKALAYETSVPSNISDVITADYTITDYVSVPAFDIVGGTYNEAQTLTLSCSTSGADIYYTTDGSEPSSTNGTPGTTVSVTESMNVKAIAVKEDWGDSSVASRNFELRPVDPVFSVSGGTFNNSFNLTISTVTPNTTIYYTIDVDGTGPLMPEVDNGEYTDSITLDHSVNVSAYAIHDNPGWNVSGDTEDDYNFQPFTPSLSIPGDVYGDTSFTVNFSCGTSSVTYLYSTNGISPVEGSNGIIGSSCAVSTDLTLMVKARRTGWTDSSVVSATYEVGNTVRTPENGVVITTLLPDLEWPSSSTATNNCLQVDDDIAFGSALINLTSMSSTDYSFSSELTESTTYYWRFSYDGGSTYSTTYSFTPEVYIVGETGPALGKIFYVDTNNSFPDWDYLEAAPADVNGSWNPWAPDFGSTGATGTAIGTGKSNTDKIIDYWEPNASSYAAKICDEYELNGYTDWFMPSKDELNLMYQLKTTIGGFPSPYTDYWSSTEASHSWYAYEQWFQDGSTSQQQKIQGYYVRPIRAF